MAQPIPVNMNALIVQPNKTIALQDIPVPSIVDDEVLVRNAAVALNPTDWKFVEWITNVGTISGCDLAGDVVRVGANVTSVKVGDRVAAFVQGGTYTDRGAFAEYVKIPAELTWKIPEGTTYEEAATLNCGCWTAAQGLFHPKRLGFIEPPSKVQTPEWIFVYGGSSSVGLYVVQFAHLIGLKVATVASPRNFDLLKSLGADIVVNYKDSDAVAQLKEATSDSIHYAYDTISTAETQEFSVKTLGPGPGKLLVILTPQNGAKTLRSDVTIIHTLLYTALGREFTLSGERFPAALEDRAHIAAFLLKLTGFVASGAIKPNPIKSLSGGLNSIWDGLQYLKEGKNSGEKVVYKI